MQKLDGFGITRNEPTVPEKKVLACAPIEHYRLSRKVLPRVDERLPEGTTWVEEIYAMCSEIDDSITFESLAIEVGVMNSPGPLP